MSATRVLSAAFAFAGGVVAGILMAPRSGVETREMLAEEARGQLKTISKQLRNLETQVNGLVDQMRSASDDLGQKVKHATDDLGQKVKQATVDHVVPEVPESFDVNDNEVASELRHMPRK
jgi:gas vesicle protein